MSDVAYMLYIWLNIGTNEMRIAPHGRDGGPVGLLLGLVLESLKVILE